MNGLLYTNQFDARARFSKRSAPIVYTQIDPVLYFAAAAPAESCIEPRALGGLCGRVSRRSPVGSGTKSK